MAIPARAVTTRRRRVASSAAALAAALSFALSACASSAAGGAADEAADYGPLTVQLAWIKNSQFAGLYEADANGHFTDAGFGDVTLTPGPVSATAVVLSGKALVGLSNPNAVAGAILEEDAPVKIIGSVFQKSPSAILSRADGADIRTPEDMVGKTIGVQTGNESMIRLLMELNGLDPDSVKLVPVDYDPSPVINGEIDGMFAFATNESVIMEGAGVEATTMLFADHGMPLVVDAVVASDEAIATQREELKAFLYAAILGWKDALADPAAAAKLTVDEYGADLGLDLAAETAQLEAQSQLMLTDESRANGLLTLSAGLIADQVDVLGAMGLDVDASAMFDASLIDEVYAEHPELLE